MSFASGKRCLVTNHCQQAKGQDSWDLFLLTHHELTKYINSILSLVYMLFSKLARCVTFNAIRRDG